MQDNNTPIFRVSLANGASRDYTEQEYRDLHIADWLNENHSGKYNVFRLNDATADSVTKDQQYIVSFTQDGQTKSKLYSGQDFMNLDVGNWLEQNHPGNYRIQNVRGYSDANLAADEDYWKKKADEQKAAIGQFEQDNHDFMFKHEMDKIVYDAGEGNIVDDNYMENDAKYRGLVSQKQKLQAELANNPYVQSLYKSEAEYADGKANEYDGILEEMRKKNPFLGASKQMQSGTQAENDEFKYFQQAKKLEKDVAKTFAIETVKAPGENGFADYMRNYAKAHGNTFSDVDFWSRGLTEISRNLNIRDIMKRLQAKGLDLNQLTEKDLDDNLTPGEKASLQGFVRKAYAQAQRAEDMAPGYTAGRTAAESLGFMAEFLVTGAIGRGLGAAEEAGATGIKSWIARELRTGSADAIESSVKRGMINSFTKGGEKALTEGAKKAVSAASSVASGAYSAVARPLEQAVWHTALQPSTYRQISENLTQIQENGELIDAGNAIWGGVLDQLVENWSESMGGAVETVLGMPFKAAGWAGEKVLGKTTLGQWGKWLADSQAARVLHNAGFNGLIGEMGEEWLGNAARVGLGIMSKDEFKNFASWHEQLEMAASFAPMSLFGLGTSAYAASKQAKDYKQTAEAMRGVLNRAGMTEDEIADIMDTKHTKKEIADTLTPVIQRIVHGRQDNSVAFDDYVTTLKFAQASAMNEVLATAQSIERGKERDAMRNQIGQELGATSAEDERGKFTHVMNSERLDADGNPYELEAVTTVKDADGNEWFYMGNQGSQVVLKKMGEDGGKPMFLTQEQYAQRVESGEYTENTQLATQYLDQRIEQQRAEEERVRKNQEVQDNYSRILAALQQNPEITVGTEDAPMTGTVVQVARDGVVVDFGKPVLLNGVTRPVHKLSLEQAGNALGIDAAMRSDEQMDRDSADQDDLNRKRISAYNNTFKDKDFTLNGDPYTFVRMFEAPYLDEDGTELVRVTATDAMGNDVELVLPLKDLEEQALTSEEQAQADADQEDVNLSVTDQTTGSLKDFRGNDIPMRQNEKTGEEEVDKREFKRRDPEAYYRWNDSRRGGNTSDSMEAIQADIAVKSSEKDKLAAQKQSETDPDMRDELEAKITNLDNEINLLSGIYHKYDAASNFQQRQTEYAQRFADIKQRMLKAKTQEQYDELVEMQRQLSMDYFTEMRDAAQTLSLNQHAVELQQALNEMADLPVQVTTYARIEEDMINDQASRASIDKVLDKIASVQRENMATGSNLAIDGFHHNGKVYIFAEGNRTVADATVTYYHERQHDINETNPKAVDDVLALANNDEQALFDTLTHIIGNAKSYEGASARVLADEIVAFTMEKAWTNPNYVDELKAMGLSNELINIISTEYGRQQGTSEDLNQRSGDRTSYDGTGGQPNYRIDEQAQEGESGDEQLGYSQPGNEAEEVIDGLTASQRAEINKNVGGEIEAGEGSAPVMFSVTAQVTGVGFDYHIGDDGSVSFVGPDGRVFDSEHHITVKDLQAVDRSAFKYLDDFCHTMGYYDDKASTRIWQKYADMLNAYLDKGAGEGGFGNLTKEWQWIADSVKKVFRAVATNSDAQYSKSLDITRVCKKNEAVINAISALQRKLGYGITPGQIMDIYYNTLEAGYQAPCPVCYVFTRYIRNGQYATIMLNGKQKYGDRLQDVSTLSVADRKKAVKFWLKEYDSQLALNEKHDKTVAAAKQDITVILDEIDKLSEEYGKADTTDERKTEIRARIDELDARYKSALNVVSQSSLDSWITQFAIHKVSKKNANKPGVIARKGANGKMEYWDLWEDQRPFPDEIALDLRETATAMTEFAAIQRFRNSRGAAAGKEITFAADNGVGEVALMLANEKDPRNYLQEAVDAKDEKTRKALLKTAYDKLASAHIYAQQQTLRGGQRMWSWSDNIERLAPDVFINILQLEMLGGGMQTYSKQLEGIKSVATMDAYVNGSLMGRGIGYMEVPEDMVGVKDGKYILTKPITHTNERKGEETVDAQAGDVLYEFDGKLYALVFDDVVGVQAFAKPDIDDNGKVKKGLFDLNAELDKAGNIIVGMDDLHVRMSMADDRIFFIIPWHSSGANNHILSQMYRYLGAGEVKGTDFTNVQEEKYMGESKKEDNAAETESVEVDETKESETSGKMTPALVEFWETHRNEEDFACGLGHIDSGDGKGNLSQGQIEYKALRDVILKGYEFRTGQFDKKTGKEKTKLIPVRDAAAMGIEEAKDMYAKIQADAFLSQAEQTVYDSVDTHLMTSGDTKFIYPYEYWDKDSTMATADVNGARYLEYCRRMGYKPKFCGTLNPNAKKDYGNFADDKGYWKLLIDRRMYDRDGNYQDLVKVNTSRFSPSLVDPSKTKDEFIVTRVADEEGNESIAEKTYELEQKRPGGVAAVDYSLTLDQAVDLYETAKSDPEKYYKRINGTAASLSFRVSEQDQAEIQKALDLVNGEGTFAEEGGDIRYSIRTKPAPKNTGIGYKVFYLKDGKLYPPMVANPDGAETPVGVWLDADAAPQAATSKTGRKKVKAGGKGTQGGSGTLAYRPGWHLGEIPYALQFNRGPKVDNPLGITGKNGKVIKVGKYFPANFVWAEVEYAKDVDYQDEAMSYGYNEAGNFQHSLAGLPKVPEDGSYTYRTNANPATDPWIITGAMKVNRILTDSEVDELVRQAGREPQEREVNEKAFEERMAAVNRDQKRADEPMFRATQVAGNHSLIAVHNLTENDLLNAFDLGGFPMPSIAITKADIGHTDFGNISLVFGKETINPINRKNKVYSGDAWTPTFPTINYKLNEDKASDIATRARKVGDLPLFNPSHFNSVNYDGRIEDSGARSLIEEFKNDYNAKQFYLAEQGNPVREYEMHEVEKYTEENVRRIKELLDKIGLENLKSVDRNLTPEILQVVKGFLNAVGDIADSRIKRIARNYVVHAIDYATNGNRTAEIDYDATHRKIDERIDQSAFEKWLEDLFSGIVEKRGIRNEVDMFTPIGNRRAWEKLYDEVTLDNVVKAMSKKPARGGSGFFGGNIFGASFKTYNSIADIREDAARRMAAVDSEELQKQKDDILNRLSNVKVTEKELGVGEMFDLTTNIKDAVAESHTAEGIHRYLKDYYPDITMEAAQEIADIVKDIQSISTKYFEAKPYRAVGFDEVKLAVVPEGTSQAIVDGLQERGVPVRTYEKDNQKERMDIISNATEEMGLRFRAVEITPETRQEMEQIEAIARVNGTYLKAPNGADTKLTPEQWAMVRTNKFKAWFGDWEGREFLLSDRYVSQLAGNEFEKNETPITEKVAKFYKENYDNKVARDGIGTVVLDARSVKDSIAHGLGRNKAAAFAAVPDVIKSGIEIDRQRNWKGRGYDSVTIAAPISINGEGHVAVVILTQSLNSNRFYLHEVALQENLQDEGFKTGTKADLHQGDIANVLINFLNTSKVVDKNGEPMVVYHGTNREFYTFRRGDIGFHFGDSKTARRRMRDVGGKTLMPVYISLKNPLIINEDLGSWDAEFVASYLLDNGLATSSEMFDILIRDSQKETLSNNRDSLTSNNVRFISDYYRKSTEKANESMREFLLAKGYDGIKYRNQFESNTISYIVFSPNQIKSATDNTGSFDPTDPDIRFRVTPEQDEEYRKAYEAGDVETARKMVDEVAKKAGYNYKGYHGSWDGLRDDEWEETPNVLSSTRSFYLASDKKVADSHAKLGEESKPYYVRLNNPMIVDAKGADYAYINDPEGEYSDIEVSTDYLVSRYKARNQYDGLIIENVDEVGGLTTDIIPFRRDNSQVKSAEPFTFDDNGELIPLSQRFNPESNDVRFRVTPEVDEAYKDAVDAGDMQMAQSLVDAAAESAMADSQVRDENGKLLHMYHGTRADEKFYVFDTFNERSNDDLSNVGSHFGPKGTAQEFSKDNLYDVYLNLKKVWAAPFDFFADNYNNAYLEVLIDLRNSCETPEAKLIFDRIYDVYPILATYDLDEISILDEFNEDEELEEMVEKTTPSGAKYRGPKYLVEHRNAMVQIMRDMMEAEGFDGISYENWYEGEQNNLCYVALYPSQIKSAEAVTYDNQGNMIPLSQRFTDSDDIRFRISGENVTFAEEDANELANDILNGVFKEISSQENTSDLATALDSEADGEVLYRFIGEKAAGRLDNTLGGRRILNLAEAQNYYTPDSAENIKRAYGWELDKDAKGNPVWKYEEPDFGINDLADLKDGAKVSDVVNDERLFTAYPALKDYTIKIVKDRGYFDEANKTIAVSGSKSKEGQRLTLIHEIQHFIQSVEGWTRGTSANAAVVVDEVKKVMPYVRQDMWMFLRSFVKNIFSKSAYGEAKSNYHFFKDKWGFSPVEFALALRKRDYVAYEAYMRKAGEVEARNSAKRADMTALERRRSLAPETEDRPRSRQWRKTPYEDVMFRIGPAAWGIRQKEAVNKAMSGLQNFNDDEINDMLMDTFEAVTPEIRAKIVDNAPETGYDFGKATVRTFADLAEREDDLTAEEWNAIATLRDNMKDALGIDVLSLNDTLWSMYQTSTFGERDILSAARRAIVADKLGHSPADEAKRQQAEGEMRFSIREGMESTSAAEMYNRATNYWMNRLKESYVDMNESVNDLVAAIEKATGIDAEAFEDVRLALNQQSSKGLAAMTKYTADYLEPLWSAIHDVMEATGMSYDDVVRYVMLKHAVERNDVFARRDAKAFYQAEFDNVVNPLRKDRKQLERDRKKALAAGDLMTANDCDNKIQAIDLQIAAEQKKLDRHNKMVDNGTAAKYHEYRENDYGGLTSMYSEYPGLQPREYYKTDEEYNQAARKVRKPLYQTVGEMEVSALGEVDAMEQRTSGDEFDKLWEKINAATKATLESQYKSNVISKAQYDAARDQFQYYVPLRGFKDTTAEDIWTYFNASHSGSFSPALLGARGRKSEAENPFNWIGTMASSAIAQNLKNESKLALYYFIANRPNQDLVSVKDVWYQFDAQATADYQAANPGSKKRIFTAVYPPFNESLDTDAAKQAYDIWEESMEQQAQNGLAYRGTNKLDIKDDVAFIDAKEAPQHIIRMKLRGKDVSLIINGNPRAAQAINGLLNVETEGGYQKIFGPILRWMSAVNTSYNPEFWISNMQRDLLFAMMGMDIKGDGASNLFKNLVNPKKIMKMMRAYEDGTLGNSEVENYYREFAESGAITGFTVVSGNETWEKEIADFLDPSVLTKIKDSKFMKFWQDLGEAVEQMARFSAYMTARKSGKDIIESTNAAKEITVNFNRKGSGRHISVDELKTLTTKSGRHLNDAEKAAVFVMSLVPAYGRRMIMFFNAATQGLNAMYKLWKKNPKRFAGWMTGYFAVGVMQAVLHALLDDDDDYMDMPEYTKRNNLLLGYDGIYLKWAMPQEARMFYAFGDMAVNHIMGRTPNKILAGEMLSAMADVMPLSATDGVTGLLPSAAQPFIELYTNKDFTGARIYNDMRFLSEDERSRTPNHPNALPNTGKIFVNVSKVLNEISGGNDWDAGFINIHPESIQHVVEGAGGGLLTTLNKVYETVGAAIDKAAGVPITGEELSVRRFPFLNRLLQVNDERSRNSHVSELFYYYKAEAEHTKSKISKFRKNGDSDAMSDLMDSKEYEIYMIYKSYEKLLRSFDDQIKIEEDKDEKKALMREQDQYRKDMIREISELD